MGDPKDGLAVMVTMMSTFPTTVVMQMAKNTANTIFCIFGLCEPQKNKLRHIVPVLHVFHEMVYSLPESERVNPQVG